MLSATSPSRSACLRATRTISPCALCKAPIVGTSIRRLAGGCACASAIVVIIRIVEPESLRETNIQRFLSASAQSYRRAIPNAFGVGRSMRSCCFEPNGLPGETEFLVAEIFPSSAQGKITHLRKGEGANGREPCIVTRHRLAENQCSQNVNACDKGKTTSQIRHQDKSF